VNFNSLIQINFPENLYYSKFKTSCRKQDLRKTKTNIKHRKITYRFELDIEPGAGSGAVEFNLKLDPGSGAVEFNFKLDLVQGQVQSNLTLNWTDKELNCLIYVMQGLVLFWQIRLGRFNVQQVLRFLMADYLPDVPCYLSRYGQLQSYNP